MGREISLYGLPYPMYLKATVLTVFNVRTDFLSFISPGSALNSMTFTAELNNMSITVTSHMNWQGPSNRPIT